jgi:hypothetical protein
LTTGGIVSGSPEIERDRYGAERWRTMLLAGTSQLKNKSHPGMVWGLTFGVLL